MKKLLLLLVLFCTTSVYAQSPMDSCLSYKVQLAKSMEKLYKTDVQIKKIKATIATCKKKPAEKKVFFETVTSILNTPVTGTIQLVYNQPDSCSYYKSEIKKIKHKIYMENKQINTVKYYAKICEKRPTNKKFFFGWVSNRAIK